MTGQPSPRTPTVGIVIPTYNRPEMVVEAVRSVLAQNPAPDACVVVDDGSPIPQAPELLALAKSGSIQLIQEANRGTAGASNRGAAELTTDFVWIIGDDDQLVPGALGGLRAALAERPDAVAAVGGVRRYHTRSERLGELEWPALERGDFEELLGGNPIIASAVLMRRSAFEAVGGYESRVPVVEDWDLWLKLSRVGPLIFPRVEAVRYRVHSGNMSGSSKVARLTANLVDHYLRQFDREERARYGPLLVRYFVQTYGSDVAWHARVALRQGRLRDAFRDTGLLWRLVRLGNRFPEGRAALRSAWHQHRKSG